MYLTCLELLFEREEVPQVVDIRHFRMELMERVWSRSIPAGGSIFFKRFRWLHFPVEDLDVRLFLSAVCMPVGCPDLH